MRNIQSRLRSRALAVVVMTAAMVLVFVVPMVLAIETLVENADTIKRWARMLATASIPPAPDWVQRIPLVGASLADTWTGIAAAGRQGLMARLSPYAAAAAQWVLDALGSAGILAVQLLLTIVITVIMYAQGEAARAGLIRFGRRLAGQRGEGVVILADRHGTGTNGLLLTPPTAIPPSFGMGSRERHAELAHHRGMPWTVEEIPAFAYDVDTADDLAAVRDQR